MPCWAILGWPMLRWPISGRPLFQRHFPDAPHLPAAPMRPFAAARLIPLLAALALVPALHAQDDANVRVLRTWTTSVKTAAGTEPRTFTVTFDPATGETVETARDAAGRVLSREASLATMVRPSPDELAAALALVRAEPGVAALLAADPAVSVAGGFNLVREAGHPCGPRARCLQFEVMRTDTAARGRASARPVERLRYVVVDVRAGRVVFPDLDPALEGNLANPAARRSY